MTDPTGTPYDPGTAQTEVESTQGMSKPHDRPVQLSWLHEGVDILLEAALAYQSHTDERVVDDRYFMAQAYAQLKALMLAGWSAPQERTLAVPNGLVLTEEQWRALEDFEDVTVMLPGGRHVLTIRAAALHPRSHFQSNSPLHDELWAQREALAEESSRHIPDYGPDTRGIPSDERWADLLEAAWGLLANVDDGNGLGASGDDRSHQTAEWREAAQRWRDGYHEWLRGYVAQTRRTAQHSSGNHDRKVPVPRSFLTSLVTLAHALREAGDYAAANSLDNFLAVIQDELRTAGVDWTDIGRDKLPEMNAQARTKHMLHSLAYDPQLYDDVRAVLEYVSAGHKHSLTYGGYPDGRARRALGRLDDVERFTGTPPFITADVAIRLGKELIGKTFRVNVPQGRELLDVPHPATAEEDLRHQLSQRAGDCASVRDHLLPILENHPQSKDDVAASQPDTPRAGYVAKIAAQLLTWYADEVEKLKREGVPGVIHEVDRAFYDLAVKERNLAETKVERLEREAEILERALESTQRGLVRMETQRDDLRAAVCEAAGFEIDKVNLIDTDFVTLAKLLARNEQMYDSEYDAVIAWAHPTKTQDES